MAAVRLEAFDPRWAARFSAERSRLVGVLGSLAVAVEHIGSTAVPGLAAKPTVDVLAGVAPGALDAVVPLLSEAGYDYVPEWEAALPERRYFHLGPPPMREFHLHVVEFGSAFWERQIRFRDLLRSEREVAAAYEALKRSLAVSSGGSRERYTEGKSDFIWGILRAPDAAARTAIAAALGASTEPRGRAGFAGAADASS